MGKCGMAIAAADFRQDPHPAVGDPATAPEASGSRQEPGKRAYKDFRQPEPRNHWLRGAAGKRANYAAPSPFRLQTG